MRVTLTRLENNEDGVCGVLRLEGIPHQMIYTLEEPWKGNKADVSCIPQGKYNVVPHNWECSSQFRVKRAYRLENVPGRSAILIHQGNTLDDIEGCILVGLERGVLQGKRAVLNSTAAMSLLRKLIGRNEFTLTIKNQPGGR